ncbi:DUF11 domain-containing protein [Deinococcus sp. HMF7620]|uniref:DUF11 domain-containing protein n=1 Tax=Deinococcus arboris TaxID=2682977 RepID=A0A7C9HZ15_9DEIO|nr:DUF11 domain-containing protein [Deinococcus arboris]MVN87650.1 DUF11 domain-containing protein [Deinococcus arboris]
MPLHSLTRALKGGLALALLGSFAAHAQVTATTNTTPTPGTCTVNAPFVQSFNASGALAEVQNHAYRTDAGTVTNTDGTYTLWRDIDHTGNGGYGLYMNIKAFSGNSGGNLGTPGLIYEQKINVPAGSTLAYQNWVRSHSNSDTQLRYVFRDSSGNVLQQVNGAVATTSYTLQTVPGFTSPGSQVTLQIYTLKDGTREDRNALKLDDLKLTCTVPAKPTLTITKSGNGPWTAGQSGATYSLTVKNTGNAATTGTVTVKDLLPTGITATSGSFTTGGWTCSVSGQTVTCTGTPNLAAGASSTLTFGVNVAQSAAGSVTNRASVGGGGDPDPQPDPATCTATAGQCATYTTTVTVPTPAPVTGVCTVNSPFAQTFNASGPLGEVQNHAYRADAGTVTNTDGTYTLWRDIDHTGNGGHAVYMNIKSFEGKNGGTLTTPGLLYEQKINVPAGAELSYQNWVRSHSNTATQLRYVFRDSGGALLRQADGSPVTTDYTLQTVPTFTSPGTQVTLQIYTLKDGTAADTNVLKLDDLKLTCPVPVKPELTITKSNNGPWTAGQSGAVYTLTVKNTSTVPTAGTLTVRDLLPAGVSAPASFTANGWTCVTSGQTVTCTSSAVLAAGASVTIPVAVTLDGGLSGTIVNKASVGGGGDPDPIPDPGTCTTTAGQCATSTTTVTPPTAQPTCQQVYALTNAAGSSNGTEIRVLDVTTNAVGALVAALPDGGTSATLGISTDARRLFTATDDGRLRIYDSLTKAWFSGGVFSDISGRLVRMAVTSTGIGYAMDSGANFWRFETASPYAVTKLGTVTSASSGAPSFYDNGDFFADNAGKLYMVSAVTGASSIDLWLITPASVRAEYLGRLSNPAEGSQYAGIAASPSGIYARDNLGRLVKIDLVGVTYTPVGTSAPGSTDLASCFFPSYAPRLEVVKSVRKVAGTTGDKVQPGDTLEYTIVTRNSGNLPAGGVTFTDALPAGTTYVAGSARVNGFASTVTGGTPTPLTGAAYPFAQPVGICSQAAAACTTQILKIDTTPNALDNEAVVTFRVTVNTPFTLNPAEVRNVALVRYTDGPQTGVPSNEVVTPVFQSKLTVNKTVQNITRGGPVGTTSSGTPGDVLEYCIVTKNEGGLNASNIVFSDTVPANTTFRVNGFAPGQDIKVTTPASTVYYTAAADGDAGVLSGGKVSVQGGSFVLLPGQSVTFCFRAAIQ